MTWLNVLERFRPAGAPGSAGVAGVPAEDVNGPAAELAPVFAAVEPDVASAAALVEQAHREARARLADAAARAAAVVAQAPLDAEAARSRAAVVVQQEAAEADDELRRAARERVARLAVEGRSRAATLAPTLAEALLGTPPGGRP